MTYQVDLLEEGTAHIRVREPTCSCGRRWFACTCDQTETLYTGPGIDGIGAPRADFVATIRGWHPTADLIYIDTPKTKD